ncbi:MAG: GTPase Der [Pseudomonadota bacterium]|nr:MAG: GTPase Der [Pseudomonadota bacterium]
MAHAAVALVGRPNVGKSTLFNRLVGKRSAIVESFPGVTRDRHVGHSHYKGYSFIVIDTGGFEPDAETSLLQQMRLQSQMAVEEADLAVLVVDAREGWIPADVEIFQSLSRSGKPILVAANKADVPQIDDQSVDFYHLGTEQVFPISAEHGRGIGELLDAASQLVNLNEEKPNKADEELIKVAVVGKPNAGKSSLVNALLGEKRMIVDSVPGTTRDPVDSLCSFRNQQFLLVDTAGIRRKGRVSQKVETYSVVAALKAIERADVALLVLDSSEMVTEQVMRIAGYVMDRARALVVVLSKWDLVDPHQLSQKKAERLVFEKLNFIDFAPLVTVSALKGDRMDRIFRLIQKVHAQYHRRIKTSDLNSVMQLISQRHPPPAKSGRPTKIYYSNQVSVAPPSFVFMTNHPEKTNFSYERYVTNQLRHYFGFEGTPLQLIWRKKSSSREERSKR